MLRRLIALILLCTGLISGCATNSTSEDDSGQPIATDSELVSLINTGLLASQDGKPELGLKLQNTSQQPLWVLVHFKTPGSVGDCVLAQALEITQSHIFTCAQNQVQADADYLISVEVRKQAAQRDASETLDTSLRFTAEDVANAGG